MTNRLADVDRYIENAAPFAQPILKRIREAVHKGCPEVEEAIKWGMPHFSYKGPLLGMAAFKQHVSWSFWKAKVMEDPHGIGMDDRVRISDIAEMPSEKVLAEYVRQAVKLNETGVKAPRAVQSARAEIAVPDDLQRALADAPAAKKTFETMSPSHRFEYLEWITDAKREATRQKRIATAIDWLAEGKSRNWKYQK